MSTEVTSILHWLGWGASLVGLLNLVAIGALVVAYAWHHGLKPKHRYRRARQHAFERLIAQSSFDHPSTIAESNNGGEWWEW